MTGTGRFWGSRLGCKVQGSSLAGGVFSESGSLILGGLRFKLGFHLFVGLYSFSSAGFRSLHERCQGGLTVFLSPI